MAFANSLFPASLFPELTSFARSIQDPTIAARGGTWAEERTAGVRAHEIKP